MKTQDKSKGFLADPEFVVNALNSRLIHVNPVIIKAELVLIKRAAIVTRSYPLFRHFSSTSTGDLLRRKSSGVISEPRSRQLAALRADSHLEKGRSPPRPLRPLGSGGTDSALRLVTCWSSDALRLSSSGRAGRFIHPYYSTRGRADKSRCSLRFPFIFLLDPLLVVPDRAEIFSSSTS